MLCFHLYPRIIRNAEHRVETGETEEKVRFLERAPEGEEKMGQLNPESGQAHHGAGIQA
jgi:hypothetical protein